ncbi:hypothetical protein ABT127_30015 [Streptomyces sp. NPDC001904]|uniref:hypothetical protein n=1 Tax=Streptomyces sp. NPDC001904 TaxID=3154531 RepID=UPI00331DC654
MNHRIWIVTAAVSATACLASIVLVIAGQAAALAVLLAPALAVTVQQLLQCLRTPARQASAAEQASAEQGEDVTS